MTTKRQRRRESGLPLDQAQTAMIERSQRIFAALAAAGVVLELAEPDDLGRRQWRWAWEALGASGIVADPAGDEAALRAVLWLLERIRLRLPVEYAEEPSPARHWTAPGGDEDEEPESSEEHNGRE